MYYENCCVLPNHFICTRVSLVFFVNFVCRCTMVNKKFSSLYIVNCKTNLQVHTRYSASSFWIITAEALRYGTCSQGISQFYLRTNAFIRKRNEPYLPLPFQLQLVLICRPRRDGRLSGPWCEVAPTEIRTCNLPIAKSSTLPHSHWRTCRTPCIHHLVSTCGLAVCLVSEWNDCRTTVIGS